jgi:hypothetical protein
LPGFYFAWLLLFCFSFPARSQPARAVAAKQSTPGATLVSQKIWIGSKEFLDRRNEEKTQRRRAVSNEQ